ncbi:stage III sporulation protein SpoIIIAB [Calderihabitans maritimus]|uniref:Stage III sporulation protein AB n=1 Tax=Calderihabitans maritimus TaxID=1246530 RepID=A0A1Z5HXL5_9FIRM|nr:stage III sporulation protein SpoIIIAB [Calderihabitans maritimus]GAW94158.1 stage III sporulation protein AB [Calderihabitans maritimus]
MTKLLGAGLTVVACGLMGITVSRNYTLRPMQLRALQSALQMLETEMVFTATPLPEALERIGRHSSLPLSLLFCGASQHLKGNEGYTAAEAWEKALDSFAEYTALTTEDQEILRRFGQGLGNSSTEEQVKNLALAREQLKQQEAKAENVRQRQEKLWRNLGFVVGLVLVLIFY